MNRMSKRKFKIGDRVRIIDARSIEPCELNKIGIIVKIQYYASEWTTYVVDMGRPRRPGSDWDSVTETCWYLQAEYIELVSKPNEQLLFSFMEE